MGAVARKPEQLDLFINGDDGRIYTSWWPSGAANTVYSLNVRRFNSSTLTDADADRILGDASRVLQVSDGADDVACPIELRRNGTVTAFRRGTT